MFLVLSYEPHKNMTIEHHIFKVKFLLMFVLVDECSLELSLSLRTELLHFDLLGKYHTVLRHSLEYSLLGAPIDCELLVLLASVVLEVIDLVFRQCLLLHCREVSFERFDVDSDLFLFVSYDCDVVVGVSDADVCCAVLKIRLAVIMMVEVHLFLEELIDERSYCEFLFSLVFASEQRNLFKFVCRN